MQSSTPSPAPSDQQKEIERNYRFNFAVNAVDGSSYWFGYSFIAPAVILPLYLSHFTSNPIIIGLIPFLHTAGFLLPQLFTSNAVGRAPRKKYFPVNIGFFTERLPVFLLPVGAALFAKDQPLLALLVFLLCYTWYSIGAGLIIVGWQDMIAKIIPQDRRGRFFGITQFVGNIGGLLGAAAVPAVLAAFEFPTGFVFAFSAAAILILISWIFLALTREPAVYSSKPKISQLDYLRTLPKVMRSDRNFLRYLIFSSIFALGGMAAGFLIVYSAQKWNMPDSQASAYFFAMMLGQVLSNLFFGFYSDRKGHKIALEIAAGISTLSFLLAMLAPDPLWFYPVFFLRGAVFSAMNISGFAIVMEFTGAEERATYIGLANTIPGIASSFAPLLGGLLAQITGYFWLFAVSTVISAVSVVLLRWTVREPRLTLLAGAEADKAQTTPITG